MEKVVLLGTQHPLQEAAPHVSAERLLQFKDHLQVLCRANAIVAIAEEMSIERMRDWKSRPDRDSTPFEVALQLGLSHRYSDPDSEERTALGIRSIETNPTRRAFWNLPDVPLDLLLDQEKVEYGKREDEWLRRIMSMNKWPLLFVCGLDHVPSFTVRLRAASLNVLAVEPFMISLSE